MFVSLQHVPGFRIARTSQDHNEHATRPSQSLTLPNARLREVRSKVSVCSGCRRAYDDIVMPERFARTSWTVRGSASKRNRGSPLGPKLRASVRFQLTSADASPLLWPGKRRKKCVGTSEDTKRLPTHRFERSWVDVFGEPRRESMIGINQLRLMLAHPRVAQPHR
jgi:hypothetical protein